MLPLSQALWEQALALLLGSGDGKLEGIGAWKGTGRPQGPPDLG